MKKSWSSFLTSFPFFLSFKTSSELLQGFFDLYSYASGQFLVVHNNFQPVIPRISRKSLFWINFLFLEFEFFECLSEKKVSGWLNQRLNGQKNPPGKVFFVIILLWLLIIIIIPLKVWVNKRWNLLLGCLVRGNWNWQIQQRLWVSPQGAWYNLISLCD